MQINGINILAPHELPFPMSFRLKYDINNLIMAIATQDKDLDAYLDEVHGSARELSEENDEWVYSYYVKCGWKKDAEIVGGEGD
ncbi:MAG: hypothetical protein FWD93_03120 [Coriobacteriia bacterium]|nr:hypothetical protein [Coriobacteriia bacterium]